MLEILCTKFLETNMKALDREGGRIAMKNTDYYEVCDRLLAWMEWFVFCTAITKMAHLTKTFTYENWTNIVARWWRS